MTPCYGLGNDLMENNKNKGPCPGFAKRKYSWMAITALRVDKVLAMIRDCPCLNISVFKDFSCTDITCGHAKLSRKAMQSEVRSKSGLNLCTPSR